MSNFIKANECVIGEVYYLSGHWFDYNIRPIEGPPFVLSNDNVPMINTPVVFVGKVHEKSQLFNGKHRFNFADGSGRYVQTYAQEHFLTEPIENPEILRK